MSLSERSSSEKYLDVLNEIDAMMKQTSDLIETLEEDNPNRIHLNGELLGLRRAKTSVRKFHRLEG
ncbi:hypothetical protein [Paenibacillus amylolyticus]|uniref:hypothetical protein n=1 Tax=Paenibacillus amylolyticus TaxID=1451 RepID=UPI00201DF5A5|nr:hypothetical protein [Paenibacillus amylolyticus]MCL6664551.1 hypothetical protein [Paenibacillus amylolyticus]